MALLTEKEVAARLRCSAEKVKRLRLAGKLAYLKGRPVLIDEADLDAYLASIRQAAKKPPVEPPIEPPPTPQDLAKAKAAAAADRARRAWILRKLRNRGS